MSVLGTGFVLLALVASVGGALGWAGAARALDGQAQATLARLGRWGTRLTLLGAAAATLVVEVALLRSDTTLNYVAMVAGENLPAYYRITSLWSALEGSLLLWLLVLSLVAVLAVRRRAPVISARTTAVVGCVLCLALVAFGVVLLIASPFAVPDAAVAARPSPLLQDHVAMGIHPPLLYAGFLALGVPYALALSGLLTGEMDASWAARMRRWTLGAWIVLTAGIVLGAWWAYAVLGWGGYWAWDPVENASLLPWLTATALLHAVAPRARTGSWRLWAAGLGGASFVLVLLATFLTRSGFVESIHAFTTSPLGPALLGITIMALVPWMALLIQRRHRFADPAVSPRVSRTTALLGNRVLLVLITLVVLVGTVLPTILLVTTGERLSVGPPWYHRTLAPIAVLLLLLMAVGPWLSMRDVPWRQTARRMRVPALVGAVTLGAVALWTSAVGLAVCAGVAAFALMSLAMTVARRRGRDRLAVGAWTAHAGIALGAVAVLGGGLGTVTQESVPVGGTVSAGQTTLTVIGLDGWQEGRRSVAEAEVALGEAGQFVEVVRPQLRWYEAERTMLAGPEIRTELLRDVYVTLLDLDEEAGLVTLRLAVTPLVGWIWASAGLIMLGGAIAGWPRRRAAVSGGGGATVGTSGGGRDESDRARVAEVTA